MKKCRYPRCNNLCMGEYCSPNHAALDMSEHGTYAARDLLPLTKIRTHRRRR